MNDWKVSDCYEPVVRFIRLVYCTKTDFQSFVSVSIRYLFLEAFVVSFVSVFVADAAVATVYRR